MKHTYSLFGLMAAFMSLMPVAAFGWGQEGHRIVAQIAYDNMDAHVRERVDNILGTREIIYRSTWPDEIKSDTIYPNSFVAHYQDLPAGLSDSAVVDLWTNYPAEGGTLFATLHCLMNELQATPENHDALVFLIHLTGDRFCPVHMGHIDDKGGNTVKMQWFDKTTNLHNVWDERLIEARGYSYSEYAQMLQDRYGDRKAFIEQMSDEEILLNNYHVVSDIYAYQSVWDGNAYHYSYHFTPVMEWQLYMAGIRLAQILNNLYK